MKIAYIPTNDPFSKHSWSGTDYYVRESLEKQGHEVYCIYGFKPKKTFAILVKKTMAKIIRKSYSERRSLCYSKQWAKYIQNRLQPDTDIIFSLGTMMVALFETKIPIYIYVDGIFEQMRTFYNWDRISKKSIREANIVEQLALDRCKKIISCSKETSKAILDFYNISPQKIETVPLGANLDNPPTLEEALRFIEDRPSDVCKLLFVGVTWERKGGDIVLEAARILHDSGMNIEVHLCGMDSVPASLPNYVHNQGFLSKSNPDNLDRLFSLYKSSHFLFVPSRAEAYGLVFCEACAFGVPSISHRLGGLTTIIEDGVNGHLFDLGTPPGVFASYIKTVFNDYNQYVNLSKGAALSFHDKLNWDVAGRQLTKIIQEI